MAEFGKYVLYWVIGYYLTGVAFHVLDRRYGIPTYRIWYRWTRWQEIQEERGWIYGHERGRRHRRAQLISIIQSAITIYYGGTQHPFAEIAVAVLEGVVFYWGFMHGRLAWAIVQRQDQIGEAYDKARDAAASVHPIEAAKATGVLAGTIGERLVDALAAIPRAIKEVVYPDTPSEPPRPGGKVGSA